MNISLLLSFVMLFVGVVFLVLSFLFSDEIQIGTFIASLAIAAIFYAFSKRHNNNINEN